MAFSSRDEGAFKVVTINDARLDSTVSAEFKSFLFDEIDSGANSIVVDLANIKFMDSSGLGALVAGLKKISDNGVLKLAGAQAAVKDLFDLTSMDKLFSITDTVEDALKNG